MDRVRAELNVDELHEKGIDGRGVNVAILDTGICMHPDFGRRILAFHDFVNEKKKLYDDASHGTHVAGIVGGSGAAGKGKYTGIAPGCGLISLKVLDRWGQGRLEHLIAALEWVCGNYQRYKIRIVNISAGTTKDEEDADAFRLVRFVEKVWDLGITVIVAAGNQGPERSSITVPGNSRKVITVGAADDFGKKSGREIVSYSGCGPTIECICKPELVAPGTGIVSCSFGWRNGRYYTAKSGTSMAAPAVAGGAALLLQREPNLTNMQVKMRMKACARDIGLPHNRQGWGMPDMSRLFFNNTMGGKDGDILFDAGMRK